MATKEKRNWIITLVCLPPAALFAYISIGALTSNEDNLLARLLIGGLAGAATFLLLRTAWYGSWNMFKKLIEWLT